MFQSQNNTRRAASALRAVLAGDHVLSVADTIATVSKGAVSRAGFAWVVAIIACIVMPPHIPLLWALGMSLWEAGGRAFFERRFAEPAAARSQSQGFVWLAIINGIGGLGYTAFPAFTWATGAPLGMVLSAAWTCGCATHLFVYFSSNRLLLWVTAGPLFLVALLAPLVTGGLSLMSAAGAATLVTLVAAAMLFGHDRNVLLSILAKQASARHAAEQANAAKSQFLATMSHELRTPLNSVIGYAELIEEEASAGMAEDARKIRQSARQLLSVIDVILDISRLEAGGIALEREHVAVAGVLEQVREAGQPLAAVNQNVLNVREEGALGEADIDHARLYQCLMQLVSNAAKFTRDGEIVVTGARRPIGGRDSLVFTVRDTGIGIAAEQQARIFEPFAQVENDEARRYEGAGLGLTLVQRLARVMDGDVRCESAPGRGSTFTLWIAAAPLERARAA